VTDVTTDTAKSELAAACYASGRTLFPAVVWSAAAFEQVCLERWSSIATQAAAERMGSERGPAEEYLVAACLARRPGALETLETEYVAKLKGRVRRVCSGPDLVDDVLQLVREKVLLTNQPRLSCYENRGHLAAWLTIIAVRTALDMTRRAQLQGARLTELEDELIGLATSPETEFVSQEARLAFRNALGRAVRRLPEKQRFALKMQLVAGWGIDQIGRALSTHRATAARWLVSAREHVERDVNQQLVQELGMSAQEVTCLMGAMRSRLELRFSQIFMTTEHRSERSGSTPLA
jgi:RNA polymerase sigma-70 factor